MTKGDVFAGGAVSRRLVFDSYARLSKKPDTGEMEKITTQLEDNRQVVERYRAELGAEHQDGMSAWKPGARRPGWERLLERVKSGASDGIVVWHVDRLFRQPRDLETLIELANDGFTVLSAHGRRDLSDPDDRYILRNEVAHAARCSDDTQRRIMRRNAAKRARGVRHVGARGFGQPGMDRAAPADDEGNRPEVSPAQVAAERAAIRTAADDLLQGVSLGVIARSWNEQGLRGVTGSLWTAPAVRNVLNRASNAGLIEYEGELIEAADDADPILAPETWRRVRALIAGRRRGRTPKTDTFIGTGVLRCGECGQKIAGQTNGVDAQGQPKRRYICPRQRHGCGKVNVTTKPVDAELRAFTIARLSDPRHAAAMAAAQAHEAERIAELQAEIADCEQLQQDLAAKLGHRQLTLKAFNAANEPLARTLTQAHAALEEITTNARTTDSPVRATPAEDIAAEWDAAGSAERRAMFLNALGERVMVIDRASTKSRTFDPERVRLLNS